MGLFRPWMSKNGARAEKAVAKLSSQEKLAEAALKAPLERTRIAAVKKLTGQSVIARVAETDASIHVRMEAVGRCTDELFLARLAYTVTDERLACMAVGRIGSDQLLARVVESAKKQDVRMEAAARIKDETLFVQAAVKTPEFGAGILDKIEQFPDAEDQLKILMMSAKSQEIRKYARIRLGRTSGDPNTLLACARQSNWLDSKLIEKIDDLALLEKTMLEDSDDTCRRMIAHHALERLSDSSLLSFALRADNDRYIRGKAAVELMKRDASHHARPLAPLLDECLRDDRVYLLAELGDSRAVAPLEALALSDRGYKMTAPQALGRIHTKQAVAALLRIMEKDQVAAQYAQQALMKLYREAKDDMVRDAIAAIPRRVYHEHGDIGDQGRSCHGDQPYVHFDLIV